MPSEEPRPVGRPVRWTVPVLLVSGAVLVIGVIVWPTQQLVVSGSGEARALADIWLWGRVQGVERPGNVVSLGEADASAWTLVALVAAGVLALVAVVLWLAASGRRVGSGRRRGLHAASMVVVLAAAGVAASTGLTGVVEFGWFAYGSPSGEPVGDAADQILVDSTAVAAFVPVAVGLWAIALVVMVTVAIRRRVAPGGRGPAGAAEPA